MMKAPNATPWGAADEQRELAPGIIKVYPPSHGGIWLAPERYALMPEPQKSTAYSQGGWYEKDCDWALVATQFPEAFTPQQQAAAASIMARYFPQFAN